MFAYRCKDDIQTIVQPRLAQQGSSGGGPGLDCLSRAYVTRALVTSTGEINKQFIKTVRFFSSVNLVRVLTCKWRPGCVSEMSSASSKGPGSVVEDRPVDLFLVEAPMVPENLLRVSSLSEVNLVLEKAKCLPVARTLITNVVTVVRGDVTGVQVMLLDPQLLTRISCAASILFPRAPETIKITLTKRYGEFLFRPNMLVSDWIDAGKLDLQVRRVL